MGEGESWFGAATIATGGGKGGDVNYCIALLHSVVVTTKLDALIASSLSSLSKSSNRSCITVDDLFSDPKIVVATTTIICGGINGNMSYCIALLHSAMVMAKLDALTAFSSFKSSYYSNSYS